MRYVLDTHALVIALVTPKKLGKDARRAMARIERGVDEALIPAAVATELLMLHDLGRTDLGMAELRAALNQTPSMRFLPLDLPQLEVFASLRSVRDPFDRLITSAALAHDARLISKDTRLVESGLVATVW